MSSTLHPSFTATSAPGGTTPPPSFTPILMPVGGTSPPPPFPSITTPGRPSRFSISTPTGGNTPPAPLFPSILTRQPLLHLGYPHQEERTQDARQNGTQGEGRRKVEQSLPPRSTAVPTATNLDYARPNDQEIKCGKVNSFFHVPALIQVDSS